MATNTRVREGSFPASSADDILHCFSYSTDHSPPLQLVRVCPVELHSLPRTRQVTFELRKNMRVQRLQSPCHFGRHQVRPDAMPAAALESFLCNVARVRVRREYDLVRVLEVRQPLSQQV